MLPDTVEFDRGGPRSRAPRVKPFGFPREARLTAAAEFDLALSQRPFRGRLLWVYRVDPGATRELPAEQAQSLRFDRPRLGLMIAKKLTRTAVLRNAIKRRLREQFRLRAPLLPPRWYVARLARSVSKTDLQALVEEWVAALEHDLRAGRAKAPLQKAAS